jgi:RNA polymerase sigma factor (sigma-70 family)
MTPDRHPSEDELVRSHLHLANQAVNELARRLPSHVNRDDLSSAAMLGLAQAARSWDPERGASFERHAATRIRGALLDELRDSDWASLNAHLDPDTLPAEPRPDSRLARRRAAYHAAIAACSDFRARLDAAPRPLLERAAENGWAAPTPA